MKQWSKFKRQGMWKDKIKCNIDGSEIWVSLWVKEDIKNKNNHYKSQFKIKMINIFQTYPYF